MFVDSKMWERVDVCSGKKSWLSENAFLLFIFPTKFVRGAQVAFAETTTSLFEPTN
jgi:hypothetical protein